MKKKKREKRRRQERKEHNKEYDTSLLLKMTIEVNEKISQIQTSFSRSEHLLDYNNKY